MDEAERIAVRLFYGGRCQYCGASNATDVEHIVAESKGGGDSLENVTLACDRCNTSKSARDLDPMFLAIAHTRARENADKIRDMMALRAVRKPYATGPEKRRGVTPQINIRVPAEAHDDIRRLGELLRRRPDMVPVLEKSVRDMEALAESLAPPAPTGGGWALVAELEAAVGDLARRLNALEEERAHTAPPPPPHEPLNPSPSSPVARLRRKAGLPVP